MEIRIEGREFKRKIEKVTQLLEGIVNENPETRIIIEIR